MKYVVQFDADDVCRFCNLQRDQHRASVPDDVRGPWGWDCPDPAMVLRGGNDDPWAPSAYRNPGDALFDRLE